MQTSDDMSLVREFAGQQNEAAFEALVTRHVNLVYSAALRQVGDAHTAEEVTQAVFIILARKAGSLRRETFLTGWLFKTTRYAARAELRARVRRLHRETQAYMDGSQITEEEAWPQIAPLLDEALANLGETDRRAVLLRYFEGRTLAEVGATLGVNEDAARKRVDRGLEKLRKLFGKRGVTLTATVIASAVGANAVNAAPVGLAIKITTAAITGTAAATAVIMTTIQKIAVTAALTVSVGVGVYEAKEAAKARAEVQMLQQQQAPLAEQIQQLQAELDKDTTQIAGLKEQLAGNEKNNLELLKLRGEIGILRKNADSYRSQYQALTNLMAASDTVKPPIIAKVAFTRMQQPQTADENLIRQCISVKVNDVFSQAKVDVDVQKLLDTGWFRVVRVNQAATNGEIRLNYLLQEKPKITQITFSGNTRFDEKTLANILSSKIDLLLDEQVIADDARKIQEFYKKYGYPNTKVRRNMNINESAGEGSVTFEVVE